MKINRLYILVLMLGVVTSASAQTKAKANTKARSKVAAVAFDPRMEQQLQAVERVTFIDSIVVPLKELYQHINLGLESGSVMPAGKFLHKTDSLDCCLFRSQDGGTVIYARPKAGTTALQLVKSDSLVAAGWSESQVLKGLNPDDSQNYPFLMNDGHTLYFAAQGGESLGGYDIFMTRYDDDTHQWLTPQSLGMPFNSTANDYLYMVDEYNRLGYFVTDRRQKAGDICIYTFILRDSRNVYSAEAMSRDSLLALADISSIKDTWTDRKEVSEALERKAQMERGNRRRTTNKDFEFIVNDRLTYTTLSQFRNAEAKRQMEDWLETKAQLKKVEDKLDALRTRYHNNKFEQVSLKPSILQLENQQEKILSDLSTKEKDIRALEGN